MKKIYIYILAIGLIALTFVLVLFDLTIVLPLFFFVPCILRNYNQNQRVRRTQSQQSSQSSPLNQNPPYREQDYAAKKPKPLNTSQITSKFCSNCGVEVTKRNLRFCEVCGSKL